ALGNVVLVGDFFGTIDVDPGASVLNFTSVDRRPVDGSSNPGLDTFILKLASDGSFVWARHLGNSTGFVEAAERNIASGPKGEIDISGRFQFTIDFDPGTGSALLTSNNNSEDIFALKLDADGNFVWVRQIGGPTADRGRGISVDASGNIAFTTIFTGS